MIINIKSFLYLVFEPLQPNLIACAMALNIKIDFEDCYPVKIISKNLRNSSFTTILQNGETTPIGIIISENTHPLMPNVYNLAFGPLNQNNQIDDLAKLSHQNYSKLFSTIVFACINFLNNNREKFLGIDGSSNARAYLYYRCIQNNYEYLSKYINIYGINYYLRILRKLKDEDDSHPFDHEDIRTIPHNINRNSSVTHKKLHNYFIFKLIE
jgi:hypothetical protein